PREPGRRGRCVRARPLCSAGYASRALAAHLARRTTNSGLARIHRRCARRPAVGTTVRAGGLGSATADGSIRSGGTHGTHCRLLLAGVEPDGLSRDARGHALTMRVAARAHWTACARSGLRHGVGPTPVYAGTRDPEGLRDALRYTIHGLCASARRPVG